MCDLKLVFPTSRPQRHNSSWRRHFAQFTHASKQKRFNMAIWAFLWFFLHRRTGLLVMGPEKSEGFSKLKDTMQRHKIPMVFLEKQEFNEHIPNVNLSDGNGALIDTLAGVLYADRALRAVQVSWLYTLTYKTFRVSFIYLFSLKEIEGKIHLKLNSVITYFLCWTKVDPLKKPGNHRLS